MHRSRVWSSRPRRCRLRATFTATRRSHASGFSKPAKRRGAASARVNASCTASCASFRSPVTAYSWTTSRRKQPAYNSEISSPSDTVTSPLHHFHSRAGRKVPGQVQKMSATGRTSGNGPSVR